MKRHTHWIIVELDGAQVGQIPLDAEHGFTFGGPSKHQQTEATRQQHIKLLEEHKDMAPGSKIELSSNLKLYRIREL